MLTDKRFKDIVNYEINDKIHDRNNVNNSPSNIRTPTNDTQEYRKGRYVHKSVSKQWQNVNNTNLTYNTFDTHHRSDSDGQGFAAADV